MSNHDFGNYPEEVVVEWPGPVANPEFVCDRGIISYEEDDGRYAVVLADGTWKFLPRVGKCLKDGDNHPQIIRGSGLHATPTQTHIFVPRDLPESWFMASDYAKMRSVMNRR